MSVIEIRDTVSCQVYRSGLRSVKRIISDWIHGRHCADCGGWFHDGVNDTKRDFPQFIHHFMNEVWPLQVGTARQVGPTLGPDRYIELRYEDLIADEAHEIERLLDFLPVDNSRELVTACGRAGSFKKLSGGRDRGRFPDWMDRVSFRRIPWPQQSGHRSATR